MLHSQEPVSLGQWHRVSAERVNKDGSLKVDHAKEIRRSSPGKAQGLNIHTPMYLGGVPSMDILPKPANVSMLFDGCIGEVSRTRPYRMNFGTRKHFVVLDLFTSHL